MTPKWIYTLPSIFAFIWSVQGFAIGLRAGFEITAQHPDEIEHYIDAPAALVRQLLSQGMIPAVKGTKNPRALYDPNSGLIFNIGVDMNKVVEVGTTPLLSWQITAGLRPLFDAFSRLGWAHSTGGGHMHLDLAPFIRNPVKFVNLLIAFHNNPLTQRIFLPVEGEPSLYQKGLQDQFMSAVEEFRGLKNPKWRDVMRLLGPFYSDKFASFRLLQDTFEIRCIGNQKDSRGAQLELDFFERIWNSVSDSVVDVPIKWDHESYYRAIRHDRVKTEAMLQFEQFGIDLDSYSNWINDYEKTRRRAMERALKNIDLEQSYQFYEFTVAQKKELFNRYVIDLLSDQKRFVYFDQVIKALHAHNLSWANQEFFDQVLKTVLYRRRLPGDDTLSFPLVSICDASYWWHSTSLRAQVLELFQTVVYVFFRNESGLISYQRGFLDKILSSLTEMEWWKDVSWRDLIRGLLDEQQLTNRLIGSTYWKLIEMDPQTTEPGRVESLISLFEAQMSKGSLPALLGNVKVYRLLGVEKFRSWLLGQLGRGDAAKNDFVLRFVMGNLDDPKITEFIAAATHQIESSIEDFDIDSLLEHYHWFFGRLSPTGQEKVLARISKVLSLSMDDVDLIESLGNIDWSANPHIQTIVARLLVSDDPNLREAALLSFRRVPWQEHPLLKSKLIALFPHLETDQKKTLLRKVDLNLHPDLASFAEPDKSELDKPKVPPPRGKLPRSYLRQVDPDVCALTYRSKLQIPFSP
jgi:hypothetical protein